MSAVESAWAEKDKLFQQFTTVLSMDMFILAKYFYIYVLSLIVSNRKTQLSLKQSISSLKLFLQFLSLEQSRYLDWPCFLDKFLKKVQSWY